MGAETAPIHSLPGIKTARLGEASVLRLFLGVGARRRGGRRGNSVAGGLRVRGRTAQEGQRVLQLHVLFRLLGNVGRRAGGLLHLFAVLVLAVLRIAEMAAQAGLATLLLCVCRLLLQLVGQLLLDDDVRIDAFGLDRAVRRRVVAGRREPDRAVGAERDDRL